MSGLNANFTSAYALHINRPELAIVFETTVHEHRVYNVDAALSYAVSKLRAQADAAAAFDHDRISYMSNMARARIDAMYQYAVLTTAFPFLGGAMYRSTVEALAWARSVGIKV